MKDEKKIMRTGHNVTQQKRASNDRTDAQPVNQTTTKKFIKRMSCVSTKVANHKLPKDASLFQASTYKKSITQIGEPFGKFIFTDMRQSRWNWWVQLMACAPSIFAIMYRRDNLSPPFFWIYHSPC